MILAAFERGWSTLADMPSMVPLPILVAAGWLVFSTLVALNSGGYRYGPADQAFYIPVVLHQVSPDLFPHDRELLAAQDTFFVFDDWFAPILQLTGASLPAAFRGAYLFTLILVCAALLGTGRVVNRSWWAVGGPVIFVTVRHRIPHTAVNAVEGYFHPRMLAFGVGCPQSRSSYVAALGYHWSWLAWRSSSTQPPVCGSSYPAVLPWAYLSAQARER